MQEDKRNEMQRAFQTIANKAIGALIHASDTNSKITTKLICDVEHDVMVAIERVYYGFDETLNETEAVRLAAKGGKE